MRSDNLRHLSEWSLRCMCHMLTHKLANHKSSCQWSFHPHSQSQRVRLELLSVKRTSSMLHCHQWMDEHFKQGEKREEPIREPSETLRDPYLKDPRYLQWCPISTLQARSEICKQICILKYCRNVHLSILMIVKANHSPARRHIQSLHLNSSRTCSKGTRSILSFH